MSTFTRRQFNRTLMASLGSVWARDVAGNRASQANQPSRAAFFLPGARILLRGALGNGYRTPLIPAITFCSKGQRSDRVRRQSRFFSVRKNTLSSIRDEISHNAVLASDGY